MNKHWHFFHKDSGVIHGGTYSAPTGKFLPQNTPMDHVAIEGHFDHLSQRIDISTGEVVPYVPQTNPEEIRALDRRRAQLQFAQLESSQQRSLRELAINPANAEAHKRLLDIDGQIAALRQALK